MDPFKAIALLPPPDAWPGCVPVEQALARVADWLRTQGIDVSELGVEESLSAAGWLEPALAPIVPSLQAWLSCLEGPDWCRRSVEEIHHTSTHRWPDGTDDEARRRLIAHLEGGLRGPSLTQTAWSLWIPTPAGAFVIYDGVEQAVFLCEDRARSICDSAR